MSQKTALERFRHLSPVQPHELVGLWRGRGVATGHPLDGVLENLGWFGKRFTADLRADALLFRSGEKHLTAVDPSLIPLGLALRFHRLGRTRAVRNLFTYLQRRLSTRGPIASVRLLPFEGVLSAAIVYDRKSITDHFRRDDRRYFFELERVNDAGERRKMVKQP